MDLHFAIPQVSYGQGEGTLDIQPSIHQVGCHSHLKDHALSQRAWKTSDFATSKKRDAFQGIDTVRLAQINYEE